MTNQNHFQFLECIIRKHLKFESVHKLDANEKKNLHIKFMMKIQVSSLHSKQKTNALDVDTFNGKYYAKFSKEKKRVCLRYRRIYEYANAYVAPAYRCVLCCVLANSFSMRIHVVCVCDSNFKIEKTKEKKKKHPARDTSNNIGPRQTFSA